jgi:hypothetical protein
MCWNVLNDDKMDPPIHKEYLRSGGATTLIFIVEGTTALSSLVMRSPIAANMVVPQESTRSERSKVDTALRPVVDQGLMWEV